MPTPKPQTLLRNRNKLPPTKYKSSSYHWNFDFVFSDELPRSKSEVSKRNHKKYYQKKK
jgi:hypothetical protein